MNRLFAEVEGIDENLEVSVASHEKAELIEAAMESAEEKILLCLGDNFNRNAFFSPGEPEACGQGYNESIHFR